MKVVMNAEQDVQDVFIPEDLLNPENQEKLQNILLTVFNKAIKKAQEVAAERMRDMMGDLGMNMPGTEGELPAA